MGKEKLEVEIVNRKCPFAATSLHDGSKPPQKSSRRAAALAHTAAADFCAVGTHFPES